MIERLLTLGETTRDTWAAHQSRDLLSVVAAIDVPPDRHLSAQKFYDELQDVWQAFAWITWIERARIENDLFAAALVAFGVFELSIYAYADAQDETERHRKLNDPVCSDLVQRDVFDAPRETRAGPEDDASDDCPCGMGARPWEASYLRPSFDPSALRPPLVHTP